MFGVKIASCATDAATGSNNAKFPLQAQACSTLTCGFHHLSWPDTEWLGQAGGLSYNGARLCHLTLFVQLGSVALWRTRMYENSGVLLRFAAQCQPVLLIMHPGRQW